MNKSRCQEYETDILAWIDGTLDDAGRARLEAHAAQCPECQAELAWLETAQADLEAIGDRIIAQAPQVDLRDAVMAALEEAEERHTKAAIVPFPEQKTRGGAWKYLGLLAAAAGVALVIYAALTGKFAPSDGNRRQQAQQTTAPSTPVVPRPIQNVPEQDENTASVEAPAFITAGLDKVSTRLGRPASRSPESREESETDRRNRLKKLTVADMINARREAIIAEQEGSRLNQLASLTLEGARMLAASPDASPEALTAAARVLPPDEAEAALERAAEQAPESAPIHYQLARVYASQPEKSAEAQQEIELLIDLDPDNALPYYMAAEHALAQGDTQGAMEAFGRAAASEEMNAYTGDQAQAQAQALEETGMAREPARAGAAMMAGTEEYGEVTDLGADLIETAQQYEAAGDFATAQAIYEAVNQMGAQMSAYADYSMEALAGADLQRATIGFLEGVYTSMNNIPGMDWLAGEVDQLITYMEELTRTIEALDAFFAQDLSAMNLTDLANIIFRSGDLALVEDPSLTQGQ